MTTWNSTLAAKENDPRLGNRGDGLDKGSLIMITTSFTLGTSGISDDDLLRLARLPARCKVIPELSYVISEGFSSGTLTIDVGDDDDSVDTGGDDDRYASGLDCQAAGTDRFSGGVASLTPYTLGKLSWILAKLEAISGGWSGKKLTFKLAVQVNR